MALSNWFIAMWNGKGKSIVPQIVKHEDVEVEVYKNYIIVKMGKRRCDMWSGELHTGLVKIIACRGPQESIFAYIEVLGEETFYAIAGYGFDDDSEEWVGCKPRTLEAFKRWLQVVVNRDIYDQMRDEYFLKQMSELTGKTIEELREEIKGELKQVRLERARIFNQGDLYFSESLDLPLQWQEEDGEAPKPYFEHFIERLSSERGGGDFDGGCD